jgi:hypothetical protein
MILGIPESTYTLIHVVISLIGIGSGLIVLYGFLTARRLDGWNTIFLVSTILTSATGFGFPFHKLLPSHIIGMLSLVLLALALLARYSGHLAGVWRSVYVITASLALYFNVFVLVVQGFLKVPSLHALAPTQKEPPFAVAQLAVLVLFIVLTIFAVRKFRVPARA